MLRLVVIKPIAGAVMSVERPQLNEREHGLPPLRCMVWCLVLLVSFHAVLVVPEASAQQQQTFQLFWIDDTGAHQEVSQPVGNCPGQPKTRPVLFVHGHPLDGSGGSTPNYQRNWIDGTSFNAAIELGGNQALDIEDYYIQFLQHDRSILADANDIGEAVALIRNCQNPANPSTVKMAIIAYSKGTISTRVYLRSRHMAGQGQDLSSEFPGDVPLTPHSPSVNPVSEFIALAAPNHGLRMPYLFADELPIRQLNNGVGGGSPCLSFFEPLATDFMSRLNGLTASNDWSGEHETPANRADGHPVIDGTLYVSIYDNDDAVGGDLPDASDCATPKRKQAFNRGLNAVNIPLSVTGTGPLTVHANTVKEAEVICQALYTVAHHRVPPLYRPVTPEPNAAVCETTPAGSPIIPYGTGVVLALDHSGSMGIPACPTCGTKQAVLQVAAGMFLDTWQALAGHDDKAGITYFRTGVSQFPAAGGDPLVPVLPDTSPLVDDLQAEAANSSGLTAMGAALQTSVLALQGLTGLLRGLGPNRHVVLFTDGLQNVNPMIHDDPNQRLIVDNLAGAVDAGHSVELSEPVADYAVTVDTIGIGVSPTSQALLEDLALETGGEKRFSVDTNELNLFFTMTLVDTLRASSPQLVAYRYGTLANDEQAEAYAVNSGARRIVLRLSWPEGEAMDFRVEKDGSDLTATGTLIERGSYKIFALDLPANAAGGTVESGGEWRMVIRGRPGIAYEAAAIVDEPLVDYRAAVGEGDNTVGAPLPIQVQLSAGGRPIENATVTARVMRPTDSIGNLIVAFPAGADPKGIAFEPMTSAGQRAALTMLQDEGIWQRLQPATEAIALEGGESGLYRASFADTKTPGIYTVNIEIEAEDQQLGMLRRTQSISTQVRVASVELEASGVTVETLADTDRGREAALRLTPRDRFGNYLGPDHGHMIGLRLGKGVTKGALRDLGDGTYVVPFILPQEGDPDLTLTVGGKELFAGPVSALEPPADRKRLVIWVALVLGWALALVLDVRWLIVRRAA